jgi:putative Mg2+ transporter-C (MgtC) family protein
MSLEALLNFGALAPDEVALRLGLAIVFGLALGVDREMRDKPAGLRTHAMVSLAACSFALLAIGFAHVLANGASGAKGADPVRALEAVATGVAFLGGGAIIQARGDVRGITTGSGIWLAGAIGLACGAGFYFLALLTAVLGIILLAVLRAFEKHLLGSQPDRSDKAAAHGRRR